MAVFLTFAAINNRPGSARPQSWRISATSSWKWDSGQHWDIWAARLRFIINHIRLEWDGLYPVLSIALVLLFFAICSRVGGNGFLGVYVAGLVVGNTTLIHRRSLLMFHDGIAWLLQIAMFSNPRPSGFSLAVVNCSKVGLYLLSVFLIVVARPLSVFAALIPFRFNIRDQMFISWAGLRGAAPIILATIAVTSNVPHSQTLFNTVFFVAVLSVVAQGTTIDRVAKWLGVLDPDPSPSRSSLRFDPMASPNRQLVEFEVAANSEAENKRIVDLRLPCRCLGSVSCTRRRRRGSERWNDTSMRGCGSTLSG